MTHTLLGVDIGGTFTDFVYLNEAGLLRLHKRLTTPADPAESVLAGIVELGLPNDTSVVHGATIATNALLERRGARTALITTAGFEDVLAIGRQTRPDIYAPVPQRTPPLVPAEWRLGVQQRISANGEILTPIAPAELTQLAKKLTAGQIESVAICLLFGFLQPSQEQIIADALADIPYRTLASELLPEYREFERTSTVVINAYVAPLMARYLNRLQTGLAGRPLRIMQSNGGTITPQVAAEQAARTALSGPAGGAVAAFQVGQAANTTHLITFDMGGTSTDVALCPGHLPLTSEGEIAGLPLRLPIIDIHTVGAGGGSLAQADPGGALQVGPTSAGADPGPVCYGRGGTIPTVTDANLLLGRLPHASQLAGNLPLHLEAARTALQRLADSLHLPSAEAAAQGVLQVANAAMERAIRHISVERGHDPRQFTLLPFGGAGPLHATDLAERLGVRHILVPPMPGVLSALGMLIADTVLDTAKTFMRQTAELTMAELEAAFAEPTARLMQSASAQGLAPSHRTSLPAFSADLRYVGQSFELTVPWQGNLNTLVSDFHTAHQQRYGHSHPDEPTEVVTVRVRHVYATPTPTFPTLPSGQRQPPAAALIGRFPAWFHNGWQTTPHYNRESLLAGNQFSGPAIVRQTDTTTLIPPDWQAEVDHLGNLHLRA